MLIPKMIKSKFTLIILCAFLLVSCDNSTEEKTNPIIDKGEQLNETRIDTTTENVSATENQLANNSKPEGFLEALEAGENLNAYFSNDWFFVYHEDNRCDGSTDGEIDHLRSTQIDSIIRLQVKNDGDGWACEKKEPSTFEMDFDLKKKVTTWDRFEIPEEEDQEEGVVYVLGAGASDYLMLYYNDNNLIIKLEYRSEDPG